MKTIKGKWKLLLYGMGGFGINLLGVIVTTYLCSALQIEEFAAGDIANRTYLSKTIIVASIWSIIVLIAKVVDGVIDVPFACFTDNLKTRWGKRRPAILMGLVPMIIAYVLFLIPLQGTEHSWVNTVWFGLQLCAFYSFYTLTMVTYYATFSEIVDNDKDRLTLSNFKTIFDVVYFALGFALIPVLLDMVNVRIIALIFLPLALTMIIPLFMIKEKSTLDKDREADANENGVKEENVKIFQSVKYAFKNKTFIIWMFVYAALQFSLQMFLSGQSVLFSGYMELSGLQNMLVMVSVFAPVPLTLLLYNKVVKKHGIRWGYIISTLSFVVSMSLLAFCTKKFLPNDTARTALAAVGGLFASFGIGCFFSINYQVPSTLAENERKRTGVSHPAMYFAVQGLFSAVATGISTGLVFVNLRDFELIWLMPIVIIAGCLISLLLTKFLPKEVCDIGKETPKEVKEEIVTEKE